MKLRPIPSIQGKIIIISVLVFALIVYFNRRSIKRTTVEATNYIKERTWDIWTERRLDRLHPLIRDRARLFINTMDREQGIKLRVTSGLRTWKEQDGLYAQGRTAKGKKVTNARGGQSLHNYGLAFDVVEIKDGKGLWNNPNWDRIGEMGKSFGFEWGGDWRSFVDRPHFEDRFGRSLAQLRTLYSSGQRDGEYVRLNSRPS